jgi:hypothetical protein
MGISDSTFCPFTPVHAMCSGGVDRESMTIDCPRGRVALRIVGGREPQSGVGTRHTDGAIGAGTVCHVAIKTGAGRGARRPERLSF